MLPHVSASFEVVSFTVSIASVVLAVVAIWLSVVFYRMATKASGATTEAAKGIAASVDRLEKLFDKLYADTFSMMRDTVSDMRKHMWPSEVGEPEKAVEEAERRADEKINGIKRMVDEQIGNVLKRQELAEDRVQAVRAEMGRLLERAIVNSRQVETEAREETVREHILRGIRMLRAQKPKVTAVDVVNMLDRSFPLGLVISELKRMREDGLIRMSDPEVGPDAEIVLSATKVSRRQ